MIYLKNFENYSTEFYLDFKKSDFPKILEFIEPKSKYKMLDFIPGMNKVTITYTLESKPKEDNPYKGTLPDMMQMDISATYNMGYENKGETKMHVKITGGAQTWYEISYTKGKIIKDENPNYKKLNKNTLNNIKKILKKYSV